MASVLLFLTMPPIRKNSGAKVLYQEAIKNGDLNKMKILLRQGRNFHDDILGDAICNNNDAETKIAMVGWLLNKRCKIPEDDIYYYYASVCPTKGLATLLNSRGFPIQESEFAFSELMYSVSSPEITEEELEIVEEYIGLGVLLSSYAFSIAVAQNCIPVMQLLIANGCKHGYNNFDEAFFGGAPKAMRWLFENGYSWEKSSLEISISYQPGIFILPKEKKILPNSKVLGYSIKVTPRVLENCTKEFNWLEIKEDGRVFPVKGEEGLFEEWSKEGFYLIFGHDNN